MFDPTVRVGLAADSGELERLESAAREALIDTRGGGRWLETNSPVGRGWADLLLRSDASVFVAELEGVPVGVLVSIYEGDGTARIAGVYVEPGARECGFGDALMDAAVGAASARGSARIEGEALPGDRETKNLYERAGITARLIVLSAPLSGRSTGERAFR